MNKKKFCILILLCTSIINFSCDRRYSLDKIPDAPEINKEFYQKALTHLNNSIEDYPDNADNYYKKALVLMELNKDDSAMTEASKAVDLDPNDPEYLFLLAKLYAVNKKTDLAIATALLAAQRGASESRLNSLLAEMYLESDSLELALAHVNKALAEGNQTSFNQLLKGKIAFAMGDSIRAEKNLLLATEDPALQKEARLFLSKLYLNNGQFAKALSTLAVLLENSPENTDILYEKGRLLQQMGEANNAKGVFLKITAIDSTFEEAYAQLGFLYYDQYRYDSASFYAEKALNFRENYIEPMLVQARILDRRRQYFAAIQKYSEILTIDSAHVKALGELNYLRGKVAYLQRQREQRQREAIEIPTIAPIF